MCEQAGGAFELLLAFHAAVVGGVVEAGDQMSFHGGEVGVEESKFVRDCGQ